MKKLFLISLLVATTNLFAQSAALTLATTNKVSAKLNKVERSIQRGSPLSSGEAVNTATSSLASLKYSNGTLVELGERSSYQILAYAPKQSDVTIRAELYSGKLHSKTSGKLKETLKTPVVALSILGTDFNVYVANKSKVYVKVNQGMVMARNTIIRAGQSYVITPSTMTPAPFPAEGYVSYMVAQHGGANGNGNATTVAQTSCTGHDCTDPNCKIDMVTRDNLDVVNNSLMTMLTTNTMAGFLGIIA